MRMKPLLSSLAFLTLFLLLLFPSYLYLDFFILSTSPWLPLIYPFYLQQLPLLLCSLSLIKLFLCCCLMYFSCHNGRVSLHPPSAHSSSSLSLQPPPPLHPYVLKPADQTQSLLKYKPSSSNQPNCNITSCLKGVFCLSWDILLNGIKSAIENLLLS